MQSRSGATETSAEVAVHFVRDDALVPTPKERITTTDADGRAPRNVGSRRINFVDDGKLFEGHFTVQSTNLKSIIQYLLDRHNEQDVIIQDLQKQVHMLRSRSLKSSKRSGGGDAALTAANGVPLGGIGSASSDVGTRLKRVEQFLQLWGVQLSEVAELVEEYGDPTITPDAYTSYLLDLPAFRLTRREARTLMLNAGQPTAANVNAALASDTAARRRNSSGKRDAAGSSVHANAASTHEEKPSAETPERRGDKTNDTESLAEATLEKATAALEKAETLLTELHGAGASFRTTPRPPPKPRRAEAASKSAAATATTAVPGSSAAVDAEARADIEELGDYVMQRFDELEARTTMLAARSAAFQHERSDPRQADDDAVRGGEVAGKRNPRPSPPPPALPRANAAMTASNNAGGDFVDAVAREDAATSLDLLEELEAKMERRFKDLNSTVTNILVRTAALAKNSSNTNSDSAGKSQQRSASPATDGVKKKKEPSAVSEETATAGDGRASPSNSQTSSPPSKKALATTNTTPNQRSRQDSSDVGTLTPALSTPAPANLVDQAARDDTAALGERVNDLEEELLDRWQAMEERLRIIGRAAMKQGVTNAAGNGSGSQSMSRAPAVDRKAREDAALSLMRLQQVEKELAQLRRQYAAADVSAAQPRTALDTADPIAVASVESPSVPLRDTYGSKVADLEKEVEQRMAAVNQAIAQLREVGSATPLTLSPQKGSEVATATVASAQPSPSAPAPPVNPGQLTLRAEGGDAAAACADAAGVRRPSPPPLEADELHRRATLQSLMELGCDVDGDANLVSSFPHTGVRVGGRRTTISRLRSPEIPPFGSHLVQREVVDLPLVAIAKAAGHDVAAQVSAANRDVATAATPVQALRHVSNASGGPSHTEGQTHSTSSPRNSRVGGEGTTARVSVS